MSQTFIDEENNLNEYYIGESARRFEEVTKYHSGKDKKSHMLNHSVESGLNEVSDSEFQMIEKEYCHHTKKRKVSEALFTNNKNLSLNKQAKPNPLKIFN